MSASSRNPFVADTPPRDRSTTLIVVAALVGVLLPVSIALVVLAVAS